MKKLIASLLMLCLVTVVVPPVMNEGDSDDFGINTCELCIEETFN